MSVFLSWALGILSFPITLLGSWVMVHPQEEKVVLIWGRLWKVRSRPGLPFANLFGRSVTKVQPTYEIQDYDAQKTTGQLAKAFEHLAGIDKLLKAQHGS